MKYEEIAHYILRFLLRENLPIDQHGAINRHPIAEGHAAMRIGYCRPEEAEPEHTIVIVPSGFFSFEVYGRPESIPQLPLQEWRGIPLLFGEAREERLATPGGERLIIYADLVASSYFLLSRYEEIYLRGVRDCLGRFPGTRSLPYRAGFLQRPIVDEYGEQLRNIATEWGIPIVQESRGFGTILLTHDLDQPYYSDGFRGFFRLLLREHKTFLDSYRLTFGSVTRDPYYSYDKFLKWNEELHRDCCDPVRTIFFLKTPSDHPLDKPNYKLSTRKMRPIIRLARRKKVEFALHANLALSQEPDKIPQAKYYLEKQLKQRISLSRHHFLAIREPEDLYGLILAGIFHDFSMGYADVAGFRLGTCRPVRWMNPQHISLTNLILHPLTLMDYTLHDSKYMGLEFVEARSLSHRLVDHVYRHGGELILLFHNENLVSSRTDCYHVRLYRDLLRYIQSLSPAHKIHGI